MDSDGEKLEVERWSCQARQIAKSIWAHKYQKGERERRMRETKSKAERKHVSTYTKHHHSLHQKAQPTV